MSDYFLHVDILVEEKNASTFEKLVQDLLIKQASSGGAFTDAQWFLNLALKANEPFEFTPPKRAGSEVRVKDSRTQEKLVRRYVNLWQVPDPPDIAQVMQQLADDGLYSGINAIVAREIQNLVLAIQSVPEVVLDARQHPTVDARYIQLRRQFLTKDLGPYLFTAGALIPTIESKGYKSFGHYQNVTGHLNTVIELWQLPPGGKPEWNEIAKGTPPGVQDMFAELENLPQAEWQDTFQPYVTLPK